MLAHRLAVFTSMACALLLLITSTVVAQETTGNIEGRVQGADPVWPGSRDLEGEADIENQPKSTDLGGVAGAGAVFTVKWLSIHLEGRWTFGLTSIDDFVADIDVKSNAFSPMGGVGVRIGD